MNDILDPYQDLQPGGTAGNHAPPSAVADAATVGGSSDSPAPATRRGRPRGTRNATATAPPTPANAVARGERRNFAAELAAAHAELASLRQRAATAVKLLAKVPRDDDWSAAGGVLIDTAVEMLQE